MNVFLSELLSDSISPQKQTGELVSALMQTRNSWWYHLSNLTNCWQVNNNRVDVNFSGKKLKNSEKRSAVELMFSGYKTIR